MLYSATYSNVGVVELNVKGIPVMRRKKDGWMNATQLLKLAGFDKPQRTRILEREVQKDIHEKVQGGYGKYQGTWIPFDRAVELAHQYGLAETLTPVLSYSTHQGSMSPPPAPKNTAGSSAKNTKASTVRANRAQKSAAPRAVKRRPNVQATSTRDTPIARTISSISDVSVEEFVSQRTPSPDRTDSSRATDADGNALLETQTVGAAPQQQTALSDYSEKLLEYFTAPNLHQIPHFLHSVPNDWDSNATIDDEGHTALHWASAMGLLNVMTLLLRADADMSRVNYKGETPLMRAVSFTNNYDLKTFPQLAEKLSPSVMCTDYGGRTVLHHICLLTDHRAKVLAAKYYTENVLHVLSKIYPADSLQALLNAQDTNGDSALIMCTRNNASKVCRVLLDYNAHLYLRNNIGRSAEEYIREHELTKQQSIPSSPPQNNQSIKGVSSRAQHISEAAIRATHRAIPSLSEHLLQLADAYDLELKRKEIDLKESRELLENMKNEIRVSTGLLEGRNPEIIDKELQAAKNESQRLQKELLQVMERSQARGLANHVQMEESMVDDVEDAQQQDTSKIDLVKSLQQLQSDRRSTVMEMVEMFAASGSGRKMNDYRRLIATSCGLKQADGEIDEIIDQIQSVLEDKGIHELDASEEILM